MRNKKNWGTDNVQVSGGANEKKKWSEYISRPINISVWSLIFCTEGTLQVQVKFQPLFWFGTALFFLKHPDVSYVSNFRWSMILFIVWRATVRLWNFKLNSVISVYYSLKLVFSLFLKHLSRTINFSLIHSQKMKKSNTFLRHFNQNWCLMNF